MSHDARARSATLFARAEQLDPGFRRRLRSLEASIGLHLVELRGVSNRFIAEATRIPLLARARRLDALLMPNYFTPPIHCGVRVATMILDLQYRHFPEYFTRRKRVWLNLSHRATLQAADCVVAISQHAADDILDAYGRRYEKKVRVGSVPISWPRFEGHAALPTQLADGRPYVLTVASQYPHKNLAALVRAFAIVHRRAPELRLVLVGQLHRHLVGARGTGPSLPALIDDLGMTPHVEITGHVLDASLGALYYNASLFVLPSLFEGFGMPAVEALGMGLPTLIARRGSLPEVTLGLAHMVEEPLRAEAWAEQMIWMFANRKLAAPPAEGVLRIRAQYDPVRVARGYLDVLVG